MPLFQGLREANIARQAEWDTGGDMTLSYSGNELAGEAGELIEAALDILNGSDDFEALKEEMGDVIICCDLIALRLDLSINTSLICLSEPGHPAGDEAIKDILIDLAIEVGMVANTVKKQERERFGMVGARGSIEDLRRNLEATILHVHRLGDAMGVRVGSCVANKFNKTSLKYGLQTGMIV